MFEVKRRRLGAVYTKSPSQNVKKWIIDNISKLIFSIIISFMWLFVLYVIVGVINFVGANVAEMWPRETLTWDFYNKPGLIPVKIIGVIFVFIYVFRSKPNRKR